MPDLDHIGIAVEDLDKAVEIYTALLGVRPSHFEEVPTEKVRTAFFEVGGPHVELLQATDDTSPIAKYIAKTGRGGVHHLCFRVDNLHDKLLELQAAGFTLIDQQPKPGAHGKWVAFVHPKSASGVLIELSQSRD